jgi:dihydropyrimidinase
MARLLVRGGQVVSDGRSFRGDVLIEGGTIAAVGAKVAVAADRVVDAAGCEVFPGGIDPHVHLELETPAGVSSDDFASGGRAALAGGTTTILDFVTPGRHESLAAALASRMAAARAAACDYGLHMSVTAWDGSSLAELEACRRQGVLSVKTYMAYRETIGLDDGGLLAVLDAAHRLGFLTLVHAESGEMVSYLQRKLLAEGKTAARYHPLARPPELEGDAIRRVLLMAHLAGAPLYIVHVSTRQGLEAIAQARQAGQAIVAETCPQYLLLDEERYRADAPAAAACVMSPPLRGREHQAALWQGLDSGLLQTLGSDHCPFNRGEKERFAAEDFTRVPGGVGGIEYRLPLLYAFGVRAGRIPLARFVDLVSTRPAKVFGLYPRKGTLRPGSDADLVVWDPEAQQTVHAAAQWQRCDHTVYEGLRLHGLPRLVLRRGEAVFEEGEVRAEKGSGQYLARARGGGAHGRGR